MPYSLPDIVATVLSALAFIGFFGSFAGPPLEVWIPANSALVLISLLLVTLAPRSFEASMTANDPRSFLAFAIILPSFTLLAVANRYDLIDWPRLIPISLAAGALLSVVVFLRDGLRKAGLNVVGFGVVLSVYAGALLTDVNCFYDRSPPRSYPTRVVGKRVSSSSKQTTYHLELSPWGGAKEDDDVVVARSWYDSAKVGDRITIERREGLLGLRWYQPR